MCGRYQLRIELKRLLEAYNLKLSLDDLEPFAPRDEIAPTQRAPVIRRVDRQRELTQMRWGIVPRWMKPTKSGKMATGLFNARSETAADKPSFRAAFRHRRCLVPATGFYEWQKRDDGPKLKHLITAADDHPFAMAGLWDTSVAPDGTLVETFAILTTTPNETMRSIHDRMPVILEGDELDRWLDLENPDVTAMLDPLPDGLLDTTPIATTINSPTNDGRKAVRARHI